MDPLGIRIRIGLVAGVLLTTGKLFVMNVAVLPVSAIREKEDREVGGPFGVVEEDKTVDVFD